MGWLWTSSSTPPSPTGDDAPGDKTRQQTPVAPTPVHHSPPAATNHPPSSSSPKNDDDVEVAKFLQEMMAEVKSVRASLDAAASSSKPSPRGDGDGDATAAAGTTLPPSSTTTAPATKSTWASRWAASSRMFSPPSSSSTPVETTTTPTQENETLDSPEKQRLSPLAESLLPTEMNCEQAFNLAYYCQSLGGQFTALYRYGGLRSCSDNWDDFWFCMRVKGVSAGAAKEDMIRAHYRKKELAKYGPGKPSSEDVWRERRARVKPGEALSLPMDEPAQPMSDAELQKWEMEYYQSIRNQLKNGDNNNNA